MKLAVILLFLSAEAKVLSSKKNLAQTKLVLSASNALALEQAAKRVKVKNKPFIVKMLCDPSTYRAKLKCITLDISPLSAKEQ